MRAVPVIPRPHSGPIGRSCTGCGLLGTFSAPHQVSPVWEPLPKLFHCWLCQDQTALWLSWAMRGTQHTPAASITFNKNMRQQLIGLLSQAALPTPFSPLTWMTNLEVISSVTGMCEVKGQGRTSILYCSFISEKIYKNLRFAWQQSKHNKTLSWLKFMGSSHKDNSSPGSFPSKQAITAGMVKN